MWINETNECSFQLDQECPQRRAERTFDHYAFRRWLRQRGWLLSSAARGQGGQPFLTEDVTALGAPNTKKSKYNKDTGTPHVQPARHSTRCSIRPPAIHHHNHNTQHKVHLCPIPGWCWQTASRVELAVFDPSTQVFAVRQHRARAIRTRSHRTCDAAACQAQILSSREGKWPPTFVRAFRRCAVRWISGPTPRLCLRCPSPSKACTEFAEGTLTFPSQGGGIEIAGTAVQHFMVCLIDDFA